MHSALHQPLTVDQSNVHELDLGRNLDLLTKELRQLGRELGFVGPPVIEDQVLAQEYRDARDATLAKADILQPTVRVHKEQTDSLTEHLMEMGATILKAKNAQNEGLRLLYLRASFQREVEAIGKVEYQDAELQRTVKIQNTELARIRLRLMELEGNGRHSSSDRLLQIARSPRSNRASERENTPS